MKRKSSIIKLSIIGVVIIAAYLLCFLPMQFGLRDYNPYAQRIRQGFDFRGGVTALYKLEQKEDATENYESAVNTTLTSMNNALVSKGYPEADLRRITHDGEDFIHVSVSSYEDTQSVLNSLNSAEIRFEIRDTETKVVLTEKEITKASISSAHGNNVVLFSLNDKGKTALEAATVSATGTLYVVANGTDVAAAQVSEKISGGQVLMGFGSSQKANEMIGHVAANKLSLTVTQKEIYVVPAISETALTCIVVAAAIALVAIIAFLVVKYRLIGLAGAMALMLLGAVMVFILALFPWVELTLGGIMGIVLTLFLSLGSIIAICEQIKSEYRKGKSVLSASYYGFRKSIAPIADLHAILFIAAIIFWIFSFGAAKTLAITLFIGVILSALTSLLLVRSLMKNMVNIDQENPKMFALERDGELEEKSGN